MVLCNQISIPTLVWKAKSSAFSSDIICFDVSVGCEEQPAPLLKVLSSWPLWYFSLISYLYNHSFPVFLICFSSSSSAINNTHRYYLDIFLYHSRDIPFISPLVISSANRTSTSHLCEAVSCLELSFLLVPATHFYLHDVQEPHTQHI